MHEVLTNDALRPSGHYSQAMVHGGLVYVSGQLPIDHKSGEFVLGAPGLEAATALTNLSRVLEAAGTTLDRVIRCTVYISDIAYWDSVNEVYAEFFGKHRPARAIVPTGPLHFGCKIEIDAIAAVDSNATD